MKKTRLLKAISAMLAALICAAPTALYAADESEGAAGDFTYDVNADGETDVKDLSRLMKLIAGKDVEVVKADLNEDGAVNTKDMTRLMKYLAGGELSEESDYQKSWNKLCNFIIRDGTLTDGNYYIYYEPFDLDDGICAPTLVYFPSTNEICLITDFLALKEDHPLYGLATTSCVVITLDSNTAIFEFYISDVDFNFYAYAFGNFPIGTYNTDAELNIIEYDCGGFDNESTLAYLKESVGFTVYLLDPYFDFFTDGTSLEDIGFESLYK